VVYLDTGCLLKLYYPEPESAAVAAAVAGEIIVFTALHELEMMTAMQLKLFRGEGKVEQAAAALGLVHEDLAAGKLVEAAVDWRTVFREAARLAQAHAARVGCRSLDILHCTLAQATDATVFFSSDTRQITLARTEGLRVLSV
jgi:predicted nucleic acid-binding protein